MKPIKFNLIMSSKIERQLIAEEKDKKRAINVANRIAYEKRCKQRKLRSQPKWVKERDQQIKNTRNQAMKNNEFVIVLGGKKHKNKSQPAEQVTTKNSFDVFGEASDDSDSEDKQNATLTASQFPGLKKQVSPIVTTSNTSATTGKSWASVAASSSSTGRNGFAKKNPPIFLDLEPCSDDENNGHFTSTMTSSMVWNEDITVSAVHYDEPDTPDTPNLGMWERDSAMFNLDGTKKSWADLMDSDDEDF